MIADLENATKAAQTAALLAADLRELIRSDNLLLAELALREAEVVGQIKVRLEMLQALLTP